MKSFIILTLLGLVMLAASEGSQWGVRQAGDRLLEVRNYSKSSSLLKKVTMNVQYRGFSQIAFIRAIDNSSGGQASILQGGIGSTSFEMRLKSGRGKSINYTVEVYGR